MKITVDALDAIGGKPLAAILGVKHFRAKLPDAQIVAGVDANLAVVGGARIGVAHFLPGFAFVIAAEGPAFFVLYDSADDGGIFAVGIRVNASRTAAVFVGQTLGQLLPRGPTIGGFVDCAVRPAAIETEGCAAALIRCSVKCVRAFLIHGDVADASVVIDL